MGLNSFCAITSPARYVGGKRAWYLNPGQFIKTKTFKMKKFEHLGRQLSREEQKAITGGLTQKANTICTCEN